MKRYSSLLTITAGLLLSAPAADAQTVSPPILSKSFTLAAIPLNGSTTLTFTIDNPSAADAGGGPGQPTLTGIGFTDNLPAGLVVSTPNGLTYTCSGTVTATAGAGSVSLSGGTLAPGDICMISVSVTATTLGVKNNTTSAITSNEGGTGNQASASLLVYGPPSISKAFGASAIALNGSTSLTFTITSPNSTIGSTEVGFIDNLPAGLAISSPSGLTNSCASSTATADPGSSSVALGQAVITPNGSCTVSVNVTGTSAGVKNNVSGAVTSDQGTGNQASASITVVAPPSISKSFGSSTIPLNGSTTLSFTISNPNTTVALSGVGFTDTLPSGLVVSTPNGLTGSCGSGTITATGGSSTVSLAGGTLATSANCTFSVNVTGTTAGVKNNITGAVNSTEGGTGNTASASITVVAPPSISKSFGSSTIPLNGSTSLSFTISNPNTTVALSGVGFTDTLPSGLVVSTPNGLTGSCGSGTITATGGSSTVSLAGGTLATSANCTFSVNITGTTAGVKNNVTGAITSTDGGAGNTASASTTVVAPPSISKGFGASTIPLNGSTTLSFTISNPNTTVGLTGVGFTDTLPSGLVVSTPNGLTGSCGSGTITATGGSSTVSLAGGTLATSANCTFSVNITGTTAGVKNNVTGAITSTDGGAGNTASASITVVAPPSISKSFGSSTIPLNGSTTLSFTISNPNTTVALSGVGFTDTLPSGLVVSTPNGLTGSCGSGTITATGGSSTVSLAGGTLATSANCTFSVNVTGTTAGVKNNITGAVNSTEGGTGNTASASITVVAPPSISKSFGSSTIPLNGSTSLSFTISNPNTTVALSGVGFTDTLPSGLVVSTPNGLTGSCGSGTITATGGSSTVSLAGGTLATSANCTFSVNITGTTAGVKNNVTGAITSTDGGAGNTASASTTVVAPPSISKGFGASTIPLNGSTTLSFTISNPNTTVALSGVGFTDTLPSGLVVSTPDGLTGSCGSGTITATGGSSTVSLAGGTLATSANCTFSVNVTGTTAGVKNNVTGAITSTDGGAGNTASASITVVAPPSISKSFGVSSMQVGSSTSLSFTVSNPNSGVALTGVSFTDTFPAGLAVSTPNGRTGSCGGGAITATAGAGSVSLAGATIAASANCTFTVNVTAVNDGVQNNSVTPASTNGGTGSPATASITTFRVPTISKAFGSAQIFQGQTTPLTLTLTSTNQNLTLTGVAFSDTLPAGLLVATPSGESTTCAGTVTAVAGGSTVSLTGSALSPGQTCTVTVNVTAFASGAFTNTTSTLTSDQASPGAAATANLMVFVTLDTPFQVSYAANPSAGESYINIVNTGANGAPLLGPGYGAAAGNMCMNVYAFSPDEQLISCCSCLLTPNSVANLGVNRDLTSTALTGVIPSSVVVKLVATLAGGTGTGTSCNNSAATEGTLVNGMVAYGSTPQPMGTVYNAVEHMLVPSTLSASEYASITGRCASIAGNGSGFGICNSCRAGALGAGKQ